MYLKHGRSQSPEYRCWQQIKARCLNPQHAAYADYGGRGITIDPAWAESFDAFLAHVGDRPSSKHSLDRFPDNDGPYGPGNVRWATKVEQNNNRRPHRPHGVKAKRIPAVRVTNFKHGLIHLPEYKTWLAMKDRCHNQRGSNYPFWGGRGIRVHAAWINDFPAFYAYVGPRPTPQHSLDRFPNKDGNYEPGNVRWATKKEQTENRRPLKTGPTHGNFDHGLTGSAEAKTWGSIKTRCFNTRHDGYARYGGAGITMCQRWRDSLPAFVEDLGTKPSAEHTIMRLDMSGHYSCGKCDECNMKGWAANCQWATRTEVNRNRRPSERSGKLDKTKVANIREMLATGKTEREVAGVFGVGESLIGKIKRRENWA